MNKPERMCADVLEMLEVEYKPQHQFPDCRHLRPLPFDFWLPVLNAAIEYDGITHFKDVYGDFEKIQKRDAIKTKYCADNGIKLLRIPYTERANIDKVISDFIHQLI